MPQLDKVTFLSQFFWLAFFYLGFYFLILKSFLPKMSRILKLRKKKMSLLHDGVAFLLQKNKELRNNFATLQYKSAKGLFICLYDTYQDRLNWLDNVRYNMNQTHYENVNNVYIQSVGKDSLKDNLALSQASLNIPEKLFTFLLLSKIR